MSRPNNCGDKPVYWDDKRKCLYWIEWIYTGNSDIPKRHYCYPLNGWKGDDDGER